MGRIRNLLKNVLHDGRCIEEEYHEYCPRCQADLTMQNGFHNDISYWRCKGCDELLLQPDLEHSAIWFCDQCQSVLNEQEGFWEKCGEWKCLNCGFTNKINSTTLFASEDEYLRELQNPYRGLSNEQILKLSELEEVEYIENRKNIILVKDARGTKYIKKILTEYDSSIYQYLLRHPINHMPQILQMYQGKNALIVVEEYIPGRTIYDILCETVIEPLQAAKIAVDLSKILRKLHQLPQPIIHRDVKPSNVMINSKGEVFLLDMNVAKWFDEMKKEDTKLFGTPGYAAPEQLGYGFFASSEKTDVFAVGTLLNYMITGSFPKEKKAEGTIWNIIHNCICLDQEKRYCDQELIHVLTDYINDVIS